MGSSGRSLPQELHLGEDRWTGVAAAGRGAALMRWVPRVRMGRAGEASRGEAETCMD